MCISVLFPMDSFYSAHTGVGGLNGEAFLYKGMFACREGVVFPCKR